MESIEVRWLPVKAPPKAKVRGLASDWQADDSIVTHNDDRDDDSEGMDSKPAPAAASSPFSPEQYAAMRDDEERTSLFAEAIRRRLRASDAADGFVVLDIGTGPFALLALVAARAGATRVFAVEADPSVANQARDAVRAATDVPVGVVEVLDGLSTDVTLPCAADLCSALPLSAS